MKVSSLLLLGKSCYYVHTPSFVLSLCLVKMVLALSTRAIPCSTLSTFPRGFSYCLWWILWAFVMPNKNVENERALGLWVER